MKKHFLLHGAYLISISYLLFLSGGGISPKKAERLADVVERAASTPQSVAEIQEQLLALSEKLNALEAKTQTILRDEKDPERRQLRSSNANANHHDTEHANTYESGKEGLQTVSFLADRYEDQYGAIPNLELEQQVRDAISDQLRGDAAAGNSQIMHRCFGDTCKITVAEGETTAAMLQAAESLLWTLPGEKLIDDTRGDGTVTIYVR